MEALNTRIRLIAVVWVVIFASALGFPLSGYAVAPELSGAVDSIEWSISDGCLNVRPAGGAQEGRLENHDGSYPWDGYRSLIREVGFEGSVAVATTKGMFRDCSNLVNVDLRGLDTTNVTDMQSMFSGCDSLSELSIDQLNTRSVVNMGSMFSGCKSLLRMSLYSVYMGNVQTIMGMFRGCESLEYVEFSMANTPSLRYAMGLFENCKSLVSINFGQLDTSLVENMSYVFKGCSSLTSFDVWPVSINSATTLDSMFADCSSLESVNLYLGDTSSVRSFADMFRGCTSLGALSLDMNTVSGEDFSGMFSQCSSLRIADLSSFVTPRATDISGMFAGCSLLESLDLSGFDTRNVRSANNLFDGVLNLRHVKTGNNLTFNPSYNCSFSLPRPDKLPSYYGATGNWFDYITLTTYDSDKIPSFVAADYYAERAFQNSLITVDLTPQDYTGKPLTVPISSSLKVEEDYRVRYLNNINPGVGVVEIYGIGQYLGCHASYSFDILKIDPNYDIPDNLVANAGQRLSEIVLPNGFGWQEQSEQVTVGGPGDHTHLAYFIPENTDIYNVVYDIPIVIHVSGDLAAEMFDIDLTDVVYNARPHYPKVLSSLRENDDYIVKYGNNIDAGQGSIHIEGCGAYRGSLDFNFKILKATPSYSVPSKLRATYGQLLSAVCLPSGFAWQDDPNSTQVGEPGQQRFLVSFTPEDTDNYMVVNDIPVLVKVTKSLDEGMFRMEVNEYTYTGKPIEPRVTSSLMLDQDYEVSYIDNINAGQAWIKIDGCGIYDGSLKFPFTIQKAVPSFVAPDGFVAAYGQLLSDIRLPHGFAWQDDALLNTLGVYEYMVSFTPDDSLNYEVVKDIAVTVTVNKSISVDMFQVDVRDVVYNGAEHRPSVSSNLTPEVDYRVIYKNNINAGIGLIRIEGIGSYAGSLEYEFEILKADPECAVPKDLHLTYGESLGDIELPDGWSWQNQSARPSDLGWNSFLADYTPADVNNYNSLTDVAIEVFVDPRYIELPAIDPLVYSGKHQVASVPSSDDYVVVSNSGGINAGSYSVCIHLADPEHTRWINGSAEDVQISYAISPRTLAGVSFTEIPGQIFNGRPITPTPDLSYNGISLVKDVDYIVEYDSNANAGAAVAIVAGRGNYTGSLRIPFSIKPLDLGEGVVADDIPRQEYDGLPLCPSVSLSFNGIKLVLGQDYSVEYLNNDRPGTGRARVTGMGNYVGHLDLSFSISLADRPENYGSLVDQGSCGTGVTWEVYDSGLLIIDGAGKMDFRGSYEGPWVRKYGETIRGIIVGEKVEYICSDAFRGLHNSQILMFKGSWSRDRFHNDAMDGFDINHHSVILRTPGDASWKQYKPWIPSMFDINWATMRDIGICGESAFWVQNEDGMLEICGAGEVSEDIFTEDGSLATSVVVREGITGFGDVSFSDYSYNNLKSFTFANSVCVLPDGMFAYNDVIERIAVPQGITSIPSRFCRGCSKLASFDLPSGLTSIGSEAFEDCSILTSISLPDSLTSIGDGAFRDCEQFAPSMLPAGLIEIGEYAFYGCAAVDTVVIPENVASIGQRALSFPVKHFDFKGALPSFSSAFNDSEAIAIHRPGDPSWDTTDKFSFGKNVTWFTLGADGNLVEDGYISSNETTVLEYGKFSTETQFKDWWFHAFKFTVEESGPVKLNFSLDFFPNCTHQSISISLMSCRGNDGQKIANWQYRDDELVWDDKTVNLEAGDYYLEVSYFTSHSGNFGSISVSYEYPNVFNDMYSSTPHNEHIQWLARKGISKGWDNGNGTFSFRPYAIVARADMAAFLYRLAGEPAFDESSAPQFTDVDAWTPHRRAILWLASTGISKGWNNGNGTFSFRPYANVVRADMAAFLYRLAGEPAFDESSVPGFADVNASTPHRRAILWLASSGVSKGWDEPNGTKTFRPYLEVARCDMAAFLHRMEQNGLVNKG